MSFKKHIWKGLSVAAALVVSVGLMQAQTAFAAATANFGSTTVALSTNPTGTNVYSPFAANVTVAGTVPATEFALGSTIVLTAPTGWRFNAGAGITATGSVTSGLACGTLPTYTVVVTATTITATNTQAAVGTGCTVTFNTAATSIIQPLTSSSVAGSVTLTSAAASLTNVNVQNILPGTPCTVSCVTVTASSVSVASDGTTSSTLTFFPKDSAGAGLSNTTVTATTSRGTLSVTSSTTPTSACTTSTGVSCTLTFRGNGTTGTANIVATTGAPNEGSGQINLEIVSTNQNPTAIKFRDNTNSGHIAANVTNVYSSPTLISRVRFQVTNGSGDGVNNELIQATVDKGYIIQGDVAACASNVSDTMQSATVPIDGTNTDGIATFTVCARSGQVGAIKVTAKNLSTSMADATATITSAGAPNKIETAVTGGSVTVTIKDKDGNEVADGTTVTAVTPAFSGAVSPACATTSNGKASFSAAASGASTQVVITVFMNDSGNPGSGGTCGALGSVAATAITVNLGGGVGQPTTPGAGGGGFTGAAPARGSIGLLVTNQASSAAGLVSALGTAGCTAESLAVLEGGVWKIYINGAPAVVNSAFPGSVAATTAFFVRCAA